jgi:hypothetical protein
VVTRSTANSVDVALHEVLAHVKSRVQEDELKELSDPSL